MTGGRGNLRVASDGEGGRVPVLMGEGQGSPESDDRRDNKEGKPERGLPDCGTAAAAVVRLFAFEVMRAVERTGIRARAGERIKVVHGGGLR
jgi:hypothetical protein